MGFAYGLFLNKPVVCLFLLDVTFLFEHENGYKIVTSRIRPIFHVYIVFYSRHISVDFEAIRAPSLSQSDVNEG